MADARRFFGIAIFAAIAAAAEYSAEQIEFFEKKIRPVLAGRCYECHGPKVAQPMGGVRLGSRDGMLKVVAAGDPERSRLLQAIRYSDPRVQMPPKGKLSDAEIADFAKWIEMGAPAPRAEEAPPVSGTKIDYERARKHWAFQPLKEAVPPEVGQAGRARTTVDRFLLARLEAKGVQLAPAADKRTLLRRVSYDLTGLPPSRAEMEAFLADRSAEAYERTVERLLASPHYGERWGRHWLDLVRYAETDGHEFDVDKPNAWRYRDWVIRAFNEDMPYDRFVREQVAGGGVASGFHYLGETINTPVDTWQALADRIDNQVDVYGKAFLGLTVACARCHDHKFDPIPTADYYALAGIFHSTRRRQAAVDPPDVAAVIRDKAEAIRALRIPPPPVVKARVEDPAYELFDDFSQGFAGWTGTGYAFGGAPVQGVAHSGAVSNKLTGILISRVFVIKQRYIHVRLAGTSEFRLFADEYTNGGRVVKGEGDAYRWKTIDARMGQGNLAYFAMIDQDRDGYIAVDQIVFSDLKQPPPDPAVTPSPLPPPGEEALARRAALEAEIPESTFALAAVDDRPADIRVYVRGSYSNPGPVAPRRFLTILSGESQPAIGQGSGRQELADRMLSDGAALMARVMVNRVWQHHFGRGLVETADNFGMTGDRPSNPELLDWLAADFMKNGWSVKRLHRLMVLTNAYRMSSRALPEAAKADPRNTLLHHMPVVRLEAEAIRDGMLAVAGTLDRTLYGPPVPVYVSPYMDGDPRGKPKSGPVDGAGRRSVYLNVRRNYLSDMFLTFDYPQPISTIGRRGASTVASQALYLMNSEFVQGQAEKWAARVTAAGADPAARIAQMYAEAFGRPPGPSETAEALGFVRTMEARHPAEKAWAHLAHVLFNTTEFMYIR